MTDAATAEIPRGQHERLQHLRIPGFGLAPADRAAYSGATQRHSTALNATLWERDADVSALLQFLFTRAELGLAVVETADLLLAGAARAYADDFLIIDCSGALSDALARAAAVVTLTPVPMYIIHPESGVVQALRRAARGEVEWLPPRDIGLPLLHKLRLLKLQHDACTRAGGATAAPSPSPLLTPRERKVCALLVEEGLSTRQIAERLGISRDTAKRHIAHIMAKCGVASRKELRANAATGEGMRRG